MRPVKCNQDMGLASGSFDTKINLTKSSLFAYRKIAVEEFHGLSACRKTDYLVSIHLSRGLNLNFE